MKSRIDITGQKFNRLTAVEPHHRSAGRKWHWVFVCECGIRKILDANHVRYGAVKSCGCLKSEVTIAKNTKHGLSRTSEYTIWRDMIRRCNQVRRDDFCNYGGRGIKVCQRWVESFEAFLEDMGRRPSQYHSVDRKDNDGDYMPGNCHWADKKTQARNRRTNRVIEYNGKSMIVAAWAEVSGLTESAICSRLKRGWSVERTLTTPPCRRLDYV